MKGEALTSSKYFGVVVVEDSKSDALLILEGLKQDGRGVNVLLLTDGEKASKHFQEAEEVSFSPKGAPDLILLDLNLPKKDGAALIREIKAMPSLRDVPLVVFSGSDPREVWDCYELGANLAVLKPLEADSFIEIVRAIKTYCTEVIRPAAGFREGSGLSMASPHT